MIDPETPATAQELSPTRPSSWCRISLRGMLVFVAGFCFSLVTARNAPDYWDVGLTSAFLVIWFWRQYDDSRSAKGAVCGLPLFLITLLAGQSIVAHWGLSTFGKRWTLFGLDAPTNIMWFPTDRVNELLIWFPVIVTALPAPTSRETDRTWKASISELLEGLLALAMLAFIALDSVSILVFGVSSIRGMFYQSLTNYDGIVEEAATEMLFWPSVTSLLLVCAGIAVHRVFRSDGKRTNWVFKILALVLCAISIVISLNIQNSWMFASAPLVFSYWSPLSKTPWIIYYILVTTPAVLAFRRQLGSCELYIERSWFSWSQFQAGWLNRMLRQLPVLLGIMLALYLSCVFFVRYNMDTFLIANWWLPENGFKLPLLIAFLGHLSRQRWNLSVRPPPSLVHWNRGEWAFDSLLVSVQIVALSLALFVFAYASFMIRESPLDWLLPHPFANAT